jgi:archaellum component FlaC
MKPNAEALQVFYGTAPFMAAILLGIWTNNKRLDDMNKRLDDMKMSLNKRIDDFAIIMNTGFSDVKASITRLETRVSDLEKSNHLIRG